MLSNTGDGFVFIIIFLLIPTLFYLYLAKKAEKELEEFENQSFISF